MTFAEAEVAPSLVTLDAHGLDLPSTAAPVAWSRGRWPTCDWLGGRLLWVGRFNGAVTVLAVHQPSAHSLEIEGLGAEDARTWARSHLGWRREMPAFGDPLLAQLATAMPGLRPWALGGLARGALASIIGQSITVQAAAVVEGRVAELFAPAVEVAGRRFWPFPTAAEFAAADPAHLRETGLTWRRAHALVDCGRLIADGALPDDDAALADPAAALQALRALPLVGPWTAASALLWGLGADDAHPTGDVALLRAVRSVTGDTGLTLRALDRLADGWRPSRGWAARLLWTTLLGEAGHTSAGCGSGRDPGSSRR